MLRASPTWLALAQDQDHAAERLERVRAVPGQGVYAASKAGARALCEVLRQEVGPEVRATMVCPGATDTDFTTDPELREQMTAIAMAPDAVAKAIAYALAQPADVNVGEIVVRAATQL